MTPALLRQVGEALYGERWQSALAADLCVAVRTVQRWYSGSRSIPADLSSKLIPLLSARSTAARQLARQLR